MVIYSPDQVSELLVDPLVFYQPVKCCLGIEINYIGQYARKEQFSGNYFDFLVITFFQPALAAKKIHDAFLCQPGTSQGVINSFAENAFTQTGCITCQQNITPADFCPYGFNWQDSTPDLFKSTSL